MTSKHFEDNDGMDLKDIIAKEEKKRYKNPKESNKDKKHNEQFTKVYEDK